MSQARTWPLSAASSGWLAPRCGRPPLPQPPQEPPPRAATPNVAGGAALVGPGCPPARVSPHLHLAHQLYSGRRTARAAKEASRCGCPPLPQPPQEPLPRVAVPNAAGGAALAGPGCPPARVSLYPPRRLVAGGDPSKVPVRDRKKKNIYIYIYISECLFFFDVLQNLVMDPPRRPGAAGGTVKPWPGGSRGLPGPRPPRHMEWLPAAAAPAGAAAAAGSHSVEPALPTTPPIKARCVPATCVRSVNTVFCGVSCVE